MANLTLKATHLLNGLDVRIAETRLRAVEDLDIVSISLPHFLPADNSADTRSKLDEKLQLAYGLQLTQTGTRCSNGDKYSLIALQPGLWFMTSTQQSPEPARTVKNSLGDTAFLTDQSDSWSVLDIHGPQAQAALERICSIDIDESVFDDSCVARTVMEHLSVIIERPEPTRFRLYSPRSSTTSFLHAVQQSLENVS